MASGTKRAWLIGALLSALAGAGVVALVVAPHRHVAPTDVSARTISAHCAVAAGGSLASTAIRISCGLDKAGIQAVLDKTLAGIDVTKLVAKIRSGQRDDFEEIDSLAAKLGVSTGGIRPALEALAREASPRDSAGSRLAEVLGDEVPLEVQWAPNGDVKGAKLVAAGPTNLSYAPEIAAAHAAEAAATSSVLSATPADLVVDCAAAAGGKLTAATVDIACGPNSDEVAALIDRSISAADLVGIATRVAHGETGDLAAIDNLARQLHLTRESLTAMLARLGANDLSSARFTGQLARLIRARSELLLLRLANVPETDGEIRALREKAAVALQEGDGDRAQSLIAAAEQSASSAEPDSTAIEKAGFRYVAPALAAVIQPAQAASQEEVNLLAPDQGGELLTAPSENWTALLKEGSYVDTGPGAEAVFGFKDGKSATFSKFAILIPESDGTNVKDFELLVGDDGPTGEFRSIGKFATHNIRMMKAPFQEFTFTDTTARFLEFRVLSAHNGGGVRVFQVRLFGRVAP